jgi:hypothetical protein
MTFIVIIVLHNTTLNKVVLLVLLVFPITHPVLEFVQINRIVTETQFLFLEISELVARVAARIHSEVKLAIFARAATMHQLIVELALSRN